MFLIQSSAFLSGVRCDTGSLATRFQYGSIIPVVPTIYAADEMVMFLETTSKRVSGEMKLLPDPKCEGTDWYNTPVNHF